MTTSSTDDVEVVIARLKAAGFHVSLDGRVPSEAAAELLGITPGTLRNWRSGKTPPGFPRPFMIGRRAWYYLREVLAWIATQKAEE